MAHDRRGEQPTAPGSSHRLPTVSASQALFSGGKKDDTPPIAFGLPKLDKILQGQRVLLAGNAPRGLARGRVTELYGPPGSGRTALCMQAASNAIGAGDGVVWIDCSSRLAIPRFKAILESNSGSADSPLDRLNHFNTPTLAHLIALLLHPPPIFPPPGTSLIVVSSLSTLIEHAYPRIPEDYSRNRNTAKSDTQKWLSGRRAAVTAEIANKLSRLAAMKNVAVLVTNEMMTKIRRGEEAVLAPVLVSQDWSNAMSARIVLFADWPPTGSCTPGEEQQRKVVRYAGVVKSSSSSGRSEAGEVVPFIVTSAGAVEVVVDGDVMSPAAKTALARESGASTRKRNHDEVADSDEDAESEYGWAADDVEDSLEAVGLVVADD